MNPKTKQRIEKIQKRLKKYKKYQSAIDDPRSFSLQNVMKINKELLNYAPADIEFLLNIKKELQELEEWKEKLKQIIIELNQIIKNKFQKGSSNNEPFKIYTYRLIRTNMRIR